YFLGGWDQSLTILAFLVAADYASGVALAAKEKRLDSEVGYWGIVKKFLLFAIIGVAHQVDLSTGSGGTLRALAVGFYIINEALSFFENCIGLGLPMPPGFIDAIRRVRGKGGRS